MCAKTNLPRILLILLISCCLASQAYSFCSLEKMKKFAMDACEHLFQHDESRARRSIDLYDHNRINRLGFSKYHKKHHYIGRSIYPKGGYLKVNSEHFRKLSEVNVQPRYKKIHLEKRERYKRDHSSSSYNNIPYCCFNNCEDDFFC